MDDPGVIDVFTFNLWIVFLCLFVAISAEWSGSRLSAVASAG